MTAARVPDDWSVNVLAATGIVWQTRLDDETPAPDAAELLAMLGLVDKGRIAPDDTRVYRLRPLVAGKGEGVEPLTRRDRGAQAPPGLAVLTPIERQPKPRARPRPAAVTTPRQRPSRANPDARPRRKVAACGTTSGYVKHRTAREQPCEPCMEAQRTYQRAYTARRKAAQRPPGWQPPKARCGTPSGYDKHRRNGETACPDCKAAQAAKTRERYHRLHPDAKPYTDRAAPRAASCGTTGGYSAHKRRGEPTCRACKDAHNAYLRARYARLKGTA